MNNRVNFSLMVIHSVKAEHPRLCLSLRGYLLGMETFETKHTSFNYKSNFGEHMSAVLFIHGLISRMPKTVHVDFTTGE